VARQEVTRLLEELGHDQSDAAERLVPILYAELRTLAGKHMRAERADHTLQPTALVHEAFLRLVDQRNSRWQNRAQFFAMAARIMRRILVDHARRQHAAKRGNGKHVTLDEDIVAHSPGVDVLALEEALERLRTLDERVFRVVELRFYAGLEVVETAALLGVSEPTVKRDWRFAKAWLTRELGRQESAEAR
jgi:RNA polymerase sigma factor (TIGR02999 family)